MSTSFAASRAARAATALLALIAVSMAANAQTQAKSARATAASTKPSQPIPRAPAKYMNIQEIKSPGGISAWLVEGHNVPLMALRFAVDGGSSQDPAGREGLAHLLTGMMDEGAGDLTSSAFQERMEELAMRMSFQAGRDYLYGSFETLTVNRDKAADLLP